MDSRTVVLNRIRTALADSPAPQLPDPIEVWPAQQSSVNVMADRFIQELSTVHGEPMRFATMADARAKLAALAAEGNWKQVAIVDRPLARDLTAELGDRVLVPTAQDTARDLSDVPAAVIEADHLLADTGSSLVIAGQSNERLLCYLPPLCIVVATADRLVEHLPAAWATVSARAGDLATRGEFVFITGPSRTSDIEKILILGVHGPMRLIVMIVG